MIDFLFSIDLTVLYFFNHTLSSPALDRFFSIITNVNNWYITYIVVLGIAFFKGGKRGKIAVILTLFLIVVTDQFGHQVLKEIIGRIRPCNTLPDIITPLGCSGTLSFPSNHALNNFAAAMFFYRLYPNLKWVLFITAALVALSRVYLGLHYPSDIFGGAIIGLGFGQLFAMAAFKIEDKFFTGKKKNK